MCEIEETLIDDYFGVEYLFGLKLNCLPRCREYSKIKYYSDNTLYGNTLLWKYGKKEFFHNTSSMKDYV